MTKKNKTTTQDLIYYKKKPEEEPEDKDCDEEEEQFVLPSFLTNAAKDELEDQGIIFISGTIVQDKMDKVIQKLLLFNADEEFTDPVQLIINSPGGYCHAGHALIDVMNFIKNPIRTIALGDIASMATLIFVNGDERIMGANATAMIHAFSTVNWGNYFDLIANRKLEDHLMDMHIKMFMRCSKYKTKKEVLEHLILTQDNYLTAEDVLKHGLCDKLFQPRSNKLPLPESE